MQVIQSTTIAENRYVQLKIAHTTDRLNATSVLTLIPHCQPILQLLPPHTLLHHRSSIDILCVSTMSMSQPRHQIAYSSRSQLLSTAWALDMLKQAGQFVETLPTGWTEERLTAGVLSMTELASVVGIDEFLPARARCS